MGRVRNKYQFKKGPLCLLLVVSTVWFCGCSFLEGPTGGSSAGKIISPSSHDFSPFEGTWITKEESQHSISFTDKAVVIDGTLWDKVTYKIKRVDSADYLSTKYFSCNDFSPKEVADVVTIYTSGNYLGEILKIDNNNVILFMQDRGLILEKTSEQQASTSKSITAGGENITQHDYNGRGFSGVLLGLRVAEAKKYTYQTLWIASNGKELNQVLVSQNLFFPRKSGFWELYAMEDETPSTKGNYLEARNIIIRNDLTEGNRTIDASEKIIDYLGNDYISIEKNVGNMKELQILPVDNLSHQWGIAASDILGDTVESDFDSLGIKRENGHWVLKARTNYKSGTNVNTIDLSLKRPVPENIIFYDTLVLSWNKIKDRVPDAEDAFTSPNKNFAIIRTKNKLFVYSIGPGQVAEKSLAEIVLPTGTEIVMAEWATKSYVNDWEQAFRSYGAKNYYEK